MNALIGWLPALALLAGTDESPKPPAAPPAGANRVAEILRESDRRLVASLTQYVRENPRAEDVDQAYLNLFEKAIEHDWFAETEPLARAYLSATPDGAVKPLALIVSTMSRAEMNKFSEALALYQSLLKDLDKQDQREFAANFANSLATAAVAAGETVVARRVYEYLLEKYGDSDTLRDKVKDDLARIALVGKPSPTIIAKDIDGRTVRLAELKGKYVLVDFWATWCGPCLGELPDLKAAYEKYKARGFEIVAVSLDETIDPVVEFAKAKSIPWRIVHNATSGADLVDAFRVNNIPASFLIGPDGTVVRIELRGPSLGRALADYIK